MPICFKCHEAVQCAAKDNVMKKKTILEKKYGADSDEAKSKIISDPFIFMWIPGPEDPPPQPKCYTNPYKPEYDLTIDMLTGKGEFKQRKYPIPKYLRR